MRRTAMALGFFGLLFLARPRPALGQTPAGQAPVDLQFEAASIKAIPEGTHFNCGDARSPFLCSNIPPRMVDPQRFRGVSALNGPVGIVEWAYGVRDFQIAGAPEWLTRQTFEIQATVERPASEDQLKQMVRALLADRFHLRLHRETRDIPVYALVIGKSGPKLPATKSAVLGQGDIEIRPGRLSAIDTTMSLFAKILTENLERPVVDKTNLDGHYDFTLTYEPSSTGAGFQPIGAAIFAPIQDLGLKLEPQKSPIEILVIDSIDYPSEN